MRAKTKSFRVGKVGAVLRGRVWYLSYYEGSQRRRPRVGPDRDLARQMAAQINGQLEVGAPAALSFEPISIPDLQQRWLDHHENVRRSSLETIRRYRAATEHLCIFVEKVCPIRHVSDFRSCHAEKFVQYLRSTKVAPNGHSHSKKRLLRDTGVKFILETCSSLFNYAQRNRHLSPYAENPFRMIEIGRMPVEDFRPIVILTEEQERKFLEACDDWQFPLFSTLLLTGLRPGELVHLLAPDDVDLETGWLRIRNKPQLGWQVKTRNERDIPLVPVLVEVLRGVVGPRAAGPLFRQRRFGNGHVAPLASCTMSGLQHELASRIRRLDAKADHALTRMDRLQAAKSVWRDTGAIDNDKIRKEFIAVMEQIGLGHITAPKTMRHTFATTLQDANVDPLIRNELMGHAPQATRGVGRGLGMTAVYTHTRPETKRRQLEEALAKRPASQVALERLHRAALDGPSSRPE